MAQDLTKLSSQPRDSSPFSWKAVERAVSEYGTPLYIYLPEFAKAAFTKFNDGAQSWGRVQIAYSLKTNPLQALLTDLRGLGSWVETVSLWEQHIARLAGFTPAETIFNGPLKTPDDLRTVANHGLVTINIDSYEELSVLQDPSMSPSAPINLGVRLCPPHLEGRWSRFGLEVGTGEAERAVRAIEDDSRFRLACIHIHLGTQIDDPETYFSALDKVQEFWHRLGLGNDVWLDIGGGYPFQHDRPLHTQGFDPRTFFKILRDRWSIGPRPPLIIEPGRYIAAPAMILVARVLAIKPRLGEPSAIILDAGTNQNIMGAFYEHLWLAREPRTGQGSYRFCGPLCMEDDIMSGERSGAQPEVGTLVAMLNSGAYSMSLARSFIQPQAPIVEFSNGANIRLLRPSDGYAT